MPEDQHYVADGLCASAVATGQAQLRQIVFAPNGDLWGVLRAGAIRRYRDIDGNGIFDPGPPEIVNYADAGFPGNNVELDVAGGYIYAGNSDGVLRWPYAVDRDSGGEPERVVVDERLDGTHSYRTVHVYDGWLYVHVGSRDNLVAPALPEYDVDRSVIRRFELSKLRGALGELEGPLHFRDGEVFARGLRNVVGFARAPWGSIYGVVDGIDFLTYRGQDVHENNPGEELVLIERGKAYGYPYCFAAQDIRRDDGTRVPPGTMLAGSSTRNAFDEMPRFDNPHDDAWCIAHATPPVTLLPAHETPLDLAFVDGETQPLRPEWARGAFVTLHGAWNRANKTGYRVVFVAFDASGGAALPEIGPEGTRFAHATVFGAGQQGREGHGMWGWSAAGVGERAVRPVGVAISPIDGALYVSSDNWLIGDPQEHPPQGAIYRIARRHGGGAPLN